MNMDQLVIHDYQLQHHRPMTDSGKQCAVCGKVSQFFGENNAQMEEENTNGYSQCQNKAR